MFPKQGGRCPCGAEGTFAGGPKLGFALGCSSPDTSFGGPPAAQPPAAPQKASSWREPLWEAPQLDPNSQHPWASQDQTPSSVSDPRTRRP